MACSFQGLISFSRALVGLCALLGLPLSLSGATSLPAVISQRKPPQASAAGQTRSLVDEGAAALQSGDHARARSLFERVLAIEPHHVEARTYLGIIADDAGNLAEAERHFAAAAISAPLLASARNNHGAVLLRLGRPDEAARQFEASLKLDRNQPSALVNLAQLRFAADKPETLREAYELFERAQSLAPDDEIARALVVTALKLGRREAAARHFRDYAQRLPQAREAILSPEARAQLGTALLENGLADEALSELQAAASAAPAKTDYVVNLARVYMARRDLPAAGRALETAVARGHADARVYALLAEVYEASGHVENAIPAMRLAIERDPREEAYRFRYGMLLTDTKAPAAAVIRLQEALQEFPRSARLWFALGVAQTALDKPEEAARAFERARELDPRFAPAIAYLGMTYDQQGRYDEAIRHYEQSLTLDDRLAPVHYLVAEALLKHSNADTARAEGHLKKAVALDARFAPSRVSLAKLYLRDNRVAEAAAELEQAVAIDPSLAEAHYQLGRTLRRLNRTAEAETALATFKRLSEEQRERTRTEPREIMRRLANVRF